MSEENLTKEIVEDRKEEAEAKKDLSFLARNERFISFLAFIAGFIWDGATLTFVSLNSASLILGIYLAVIIVGIILYNAVLIRTMPGSFPRKSVAWIPFLVQFMFGTLFNAWLIFYTRSAELSTSWIFLTVLAVVVIGNEVLHRRRDRLTFQLIMFFIAEFLYLVFVIPILIGKMGQAVFLLSGVASLLVLSLVSSFLYRFAKPRFLESRKTRAFIILAVFVLFNYFYFANIIPPIPLSLRSIDVYHSVVRAGSDYNVEYESQDSGFLFWKPENIFHVASGQPAYIFSAIFAPTKIQVGILHEWSYWSVETNSWVVVNEVRYDIQGGRDGGYRGYSRKDNITTGRWRVRIMTDQGQKIGTIYFTVVVGGAMSDLLTKTL